MIRKFEKFVESITFRYNQSLDKRFWIDGKLDEIIREKLIKIATDFITGILPEHTDIVQDITLTGSLANYNYNQFSDLDVHIIVDFSKLNSEPENIRKMFDGQGFIWNHKHDITLRKADVEVYVQDISEPHDSSGVYSLTNDEWIKKPEFNPPTVSEEKVLKVYNYYVDNINILLSKSNEKIDNENAKVYYDVCNNLKKKLKKDRKEGLAQPQKEFSPRNLAFKELRNTGYIEKLLGLENKFYDMQFIQ